MTPEEHVPSIDDKLRAELRAILESDTSSVGGLCGQWRSLAVWAPRFTCTRNGKRVIDFGFAVRATSAYWSTSGRAVELEWAEAFRESTKKLRPAIREAKLPTVPRQELLQCLDKVLDGNAADLEEAVRQVDLIVRELEDLHGVCAAVAAEVSAKPVELKSVLHDSPSASVVTQFHRSVTDLVGLLRQTLELVGEQPDGVGRYMIDVAVSTEAFGGRALRLSQPELTDQWHRVVGALVRQFRQATTLWSKVRLEFAAVGERASFRTLSSSSHHGLAIEIADAILLGVDRAVIAGVAGDAGRKRRSARSNLFWDSRGDQPVWSIRPLAGEIRNGELWRGFDTNLDREYSLALDRLRERSSTPIPQKPDKPAIVREHGEHVALTALVAKNPGWSNDQFAQALGMGRSTFYRRGFGELIKKYRAAVQATGSPRRGRKLHDGAVEAEAD